jgi:hypothetical protein
MMQEWDFWRKFPLTNLNAMVDEIGNTVRGETKRTGMKILFSDCVDLRVRRKGNHRESNQWKLIMEYKQNCDYEDFKEVSE